MHDTLTSAIVGIDRMDAAAYLFFVCKMLGVVIVGISGILGAAVTIYKSCTFFWGRFIAHVASSISGQYATPAQLESEIKQSHDQISTLIKDGFSDGEDRFLRGDARMTSIESRLDRLPCLAHAGASVCAH